MVVMLMVIMAVAVSVSMRMVMIVVIMSMVVIVFVLTAEVVMAITRMQDLHLNQVEDQAHDSNDEHDISLDLRRHEEALGCFDKQPARHDPDRRDRDKSTDDLSA